MGTVTRRYGHGHGGTEAGLGSAGPGMIGGFGRPPATVPVDVRLYGLVDVGVLGQDADTLARLAADAVSGGCTLLQYRDKEMSDARAALERIRRVLAAVGGRAPVLVNDRIDLALAAGADGVHLGQGDLHPEEVRKLLPEGKIIGLTIKTGSQADELYRMPVDYACIGGVFATGSKENPDPPIGLEGLQRIVFRARLARGPGFPLAAIAGIDAHNAAAVIESGVEGVAVISALFKGAATARHAQDLRARIDAALNKRRGAP